MARGRRQGYPGQSIYAAAVSLPGMPWGKALRSPFPHPPHRQHRHNDPSCRDAAAAILRRHDNFEADITIAVRDFLILPGPANARDCYV